AGNQQLAIDTRCVELADEPCHPFNGSYRADIADRQRIAFTADTGRSGCRDLPCIVHHILGYVFEISILAKSLQQAVADADYGSHLPGRPSVPLPQYAA